jgi:hypothetical protein
MINLLRFKWKNKPAACQATLTKTRLELKQPYWKIDMLERTRFCSLITCVILMVSRFIGLNESR